MRQSAFAAVLLMIAVPPALAQAGTDGPKAGIDGAGSAGPDGKPGPSGKQGQGQQAATSGSKMVKQGDGGASPSANGAASKP